MKVKLTIGDWSQDGHNQYDEFVYESNKSVQEIRQAYKDSCKLTGIQFNHNKDYTEVIGNKYGTERHICTEYEDNSVSDLAKEILKKHGIKLWRDGEEDYYIESIEEFIDILIQFIKLSLPDLVLEEASFKKSELKNIQPINGWWNDELNHQFGYGLFS